MRLPIILDTDPGIDDAIALLLALGSEELDIIRVTAVSGNLPASTTCLNLIRVPAAPVNQYVDGPAAAL